MHIKKWKVWGEQRIKTRHGETVDDDDDDVCYAKCGKKNCVLCSQDYRCFNMTNTDDDW